MMADNDVDAIKTALDENKTVLHDIQRDLATVCLFVKGPEGKPERGAVVRLDRLEQAAKQKARVIGATVSAAIAAAVAAAWAALTK